MPVYLHSERWLSVADKEPVMGGLYHVFNFNQSIVCLFVLERAELFRHVLIVTHTPPPYGKTHTNSVTTPKTIATITQ
jgi:hypothetical protein